MVITLGRFDVHRFILTYPPPHKKTAYEQSNSGALMVTGDICGCCHASCSSSKYFFWVTHVQRVAVSPARLISPVLMALVFASMSHFTFLIKKEGKCV